jgi:hypothetical protein
MQTNTWDRTAPFCAPDAVPRERLDILSGSTILYHFLYYFYSFYEITPNTCCKLSFVSINTTLIDVRKYNRNLTLEIRVQGAPWKFSINISRFKSG